ncbi:MAG: FCD domain-containing protein [Cyanobacteria bacterium J06632_3]
MAQANLSEPIDAVSMQLEANASEANGSEANGPEGSRQVSPTQNRAEKRGASAQIIEHSQADELENRLHIDQSFHRLLAESSGNPWLADLLDQIFSKMSLLRLTTTYQNPDVLEIWAEHERIVSAIEQRDSQAAAIAVRKHLIESKLRVVEALQGMESNVGMESNIFLQNVTPLY